LSVANASRIALSLSLSAGSGSAGALERNHPKEGSFSKHQPNA